MTGSGTYASGTGSAGFDPVGTVSAPPLTQNAPKALKFNPATRDFDITEGVYAALHPVDQRVALALTIELGSIPSAPNVGHTLRRMRRSSGATVEADAKDRVRQALKTLLDAEDIAIDRIEVDAETRGRVIVVVYYVNLRLGPDATRKATVR